MKTAGKIKMPTPDAGTLPDPWRNAVHAADRPESQMAAPPHTSIRFRTCRQWQSAQYFLGLPQNLDKNTRVLVAVHGISRNAREHARIFSRYCNQLDMVVVAPLFAKSTFPRFQTLGFGNARSGPRSDLALNAILDEVHAITGARTDQVQMFGFSGGGQFVQRYMLVEPDRVLAAVLAAPGWYTFPDPKVPFPRGLRINSKKSNLALQWRKALRIPTAVFVGTLDLRRDSSLNAAAKIDAQQGRTRLERGRRWIAAMCSAARSLGLETHIVCREFAGIDHSFTGSVFTGQMDREALEFLVKATTPSKLPHAYQPNCSTARPRFVM